MIFKILNVLAFFLILAAAVFFMIALVSTSETQISYTKVIKSPNAIVWRTLLNLEKMPQWNGDLNKSELEKGDLLKVGAVIKSYLNAKDDNLYYREEIIELISEKNLALLRIMDSQSNHLTKHRLDFQLKPLLDGSTEVTLLLSYRVNSVIMKIYNAFYLKRVLESKVTNRLDRFKQIIENV
jgi:uncharacterized membrane protein